MNGERDPLLELLRTYYGHRWSIRRTNNLWIATARDRDADHAPTLVQPEVNRFLAELDDPPPRAARPYRSLLDADHLSHRSHDLADGVRLFTDRRPDEEPPNPQR
ncbi:hypothetical protein [Nocardiopsis suaedae]|uniref:Uncharacterized protein n=1 Tax=Nocardiopsis suaedae TaxID=3018444 RepID=A0ABT4TG43_9ACTN|nr:hypothetical protein [Nocardiopsis suaedae]MDA2803680.1 hypothetical protein [Nocardiopsis suaedae]